MKTCLRISLALSLAWFSACKDGPVEHSLPAPPKLCDCLEGSEQNATYRLTLQGQAAGWSHLNICACDQPEGHRLIWGKRQLSFMRGESRVKLLTRFVNQLDTQGAPVRLYTIKGQSDTEPMRLEATRLGSKLHIRQADNTHQIPLEPMALEEESFTFFLWSSSNKPVLDKELKRRVFSLEKGGYLDDTIKVTQILSDGSFWIAHRPGSIPGLEVKQLLDAGGLPIRIESQLGRLRMSAVRAKEASKKTLLSAPDLTPLMSASTQGRIDNPAQLAQARYRLRGLPAEITREGLKGPGQKVQSMPSSGEAYIEVRRLSEPKASGEIRVADARYLKDSHLLGIATPAIQALSKKLTDSKQSPWSQAKRLRAWVAGEIRSDMGMNFAAAPVVLRTRRGDCSEKSLLLVSLARASKIPARAVAGLVYHRGKFSGHMWVEVWTKDGWRPMDAALGGEQVSAARIRLEEVALGFGENGPGLLAGKALALGLRVDILEPSTSSP
ncbi:MAG: transglutaminase domain-containing protein [Deltaproteobacteria bacterium]|nr:transglutaminase domain-containing protein [Deltaproteobacteria bacterium]